MADGTVVFANKTTIQLPRCPTGSAATLPAQVPAYYIEHAVWNPGAIVSITQFSGTWIVPDNPSTIGGQLIYLWIGTEDWNGFDLTQTVLQFGSNGVFGGPYWTIADWYVDQLGIVNSAGPVRVNPHDTINGYVYTNTFPCLPLSICSFFATIIDQTTGQGSTLILGGNDLNDWQSQAWVALESYFVPTCSYYPSSGSTSFGSLSLSNNLIGLTPGWNGVIDSNDGCGERIQVVNPANVILYYTGAIPPSPAVAEAA